MVGVREFAAEIGQCFDLLVVAATEREALLPEKLVADDLGDCLVTLAAIDSGSWGS